MSAILERSDEDRLLESRIVTASELLRAGGEYRSGMLMIPETVKNRIRKIGDLAHAKIIATNSEDIEAALFFQIEKAFGTKEYHNLTSADAETLISIVRSLGATNTEKIRRRLPKGPGNRMGFLDYKTWKEFAGFAVLVIMEGIRYRKTDACELFENNKYLQDKTLD